MTWRKLVVLVVACMLAPMAWAAEATGLWKGQADSGTEIVLNLKVEGQSLTGTATLGGGKEQPISNGKIDKDELSFSMPSLYGGGTVNAKGKLEGDSLKLSLEMAMGTAQATLKRQ